LFNTYFDELKVPQNERSQRRRCREFVSAKLAEGGVDLKILFPGIVCIKPISAAGKCTKAGSEPNAARCQTDCPHFVALPSRKAPVREIIEWLTSELMDPAVHRNILLLSWYRAQLIDQVKIFADIHRECLADQRIRCALGPAVEQLGVPVGR
jgi:hypothetical protein